MSGPDRWEDLERRLASRFEAALAQFRGSFRDRLNASNSALLSALDAVEIPPHPTLTPEEIAELTPPAAPPPAIAPADSYADLLAGFVALDRATSQAEILEALLAQALGFGSRAALFLTRGDGIHGWGAAGFADGDPVAGRSFDFSSGDAWSALAEGRGVVVLDSGARSAIAAGLEVAASDEAALVPLVLRDRIAASLYADRSAADPPLELPALQMLAHAAAQALELLALRTRRETPTLHLAAAESAPSEGLGLWEAAAVATPAAAPTPAAAVEEPLEPEFEFTEEPSIGLVEDAAPAAAPERLTVDAVAPVAVAESFSEDWEIAEAAAPEPPIEPPAIAAPPAPEVEALEASAHGFELATGDAEAEAGSLEVAIETTTAPFRTTPEPTPAAPIVAPPPPAIEPSPLATQAWNWQPPAPQPVVAPPSAAATIATPAPPRVEPPEVADDATVMVKRAEPLPPPVVTPPPPVDTHDSTEPGFSPPRADDREDAMDRTSSGRRTTEVLPPPDLMGPGLAFTQRQGAPRPTGENALHDEARRLARLLVSEIKLYNEEQVDEGRRNRDIYHRLKEDIDRSRQIYEERIHESIRGTTDYFHQELVRSLGGGDPRALGI